MEDDEMALTEKKDEIKEKTVTPNSFIKTFLDQQPVFRNKRIVKKIEDLVLCMWNLTGNITVIKGGDPGNGTCFLQRINRNHYTEKDCATMTFTTAYHIFGERQEVTDTSYILPGKFSDFNTTVELTLDQNASVNLKNFTLVESDKEYFCKNDWCAVECKYDDMEKVKLLEDFLDRYQTLQKEIFDLSKEVIYENVNFVIIVGHPNGGEKRVSLGKLIDKEVLKEVRSEQRWCRYYYDAPTWSGSSGSPIYIFRQTITGFGYWFGHPHNHAKLIDKYGGYTNVGISSIGAERID